MKKKAPKIAAIVIAVAAVVAGVVALVKKFKKA